MLERLRPIRNTCNVCECDDGARNGEGRSAEVGCVGEGRIASIIHDIKAPDPMVMVVVGQELIEVARLIFDGET